MIKPQPAVILAGGRTGGTFLAGCLSNHPDIFCVRGEPLHRGSRWGVAVPDQAERLRLIWSQLHYKTCLCKLMHNHALRDQVWTCITEYEPQVRIIYLTRENIIKQAVSIAINIAYRSGKAPDHPTHTFERIHPSPITLDPHYVFDWCRGLVLRQEEWNQRFIESELPVLRVTYEQLTNDTEVSSIDSNEICEFLGVPYQKLYSDMRKTHRQSMVKTVSNWDEIAAFLQLTDFASYVDEISNEVTP